MKRLLARAMPAVLLAATLAADVARADKKPASEPACGEFGTSVHYEKSPSDAARRALKEEKLVLVLHVSGHFEDSDFT